MTKRHVGNSRRLSGTSGLITARGVNIDDGRGVATSRLDSALQDAGKSAYNF
jgi:hypothetical protein